MADPSEKSLSDASTAGKKTQALNPDGKLDTVEVVFPVPIASKIEDIPIKEYQSNLSHF